MAVNGFQGKYRFLSNFFIEPDGTHVEGEYQALKCVNDSDKKKFIGLAPGQAKKMGRTVAMRPDFDIFKVSLMYTLLFSKFRDHQELADLLLATGNEELVEENTWGDVFWGKCGGVGENQLGELLMSVRGYLRFVG